jgi:hypothetical protein
MAQAGRNPQEVRIMALFAKTLEARLKVAHQQRIDNVVKLETAQNRLSAASDKLKKVAIDGDEKAHEAAIEDHLRCERKVASLEEARTTIAADIAAIEKEIAAEADAKLRSETAAAIDALISRWSEQEAAFISAAKSLEATAKEAAAITIDAAGSALFLSQAVEQLPHAGLVVCAGLKYHAEAVVGGRAKPTLPTHEAPPPKLALVERPSVETVFVMRPARYREADGRMKLLGKYRVYELPLVIAEKALKSGAAVPVTDPRRRELEGLVGMVLPDESRCEAIDGSPPSTVNVGPVITSSSPLFEPLDRGPPVHGVLPVQMVAGGQRSLAEEEDVP